MHRRDFLKTLAAGTISYGVLGCANGFTPGRTVKRKPNFVFILIDDMGWNDLGYTGSKYYETPRIDTLASEGVVFTQAYSNAPNCAPTRACLISGQYTPRHGVYTVGTPERGPAKRRKLIPTPNTTELGTEHVTIAESLKPAGYTCACLGKWHLGDKAPYRPQDRGFDVVDDRSKRGHWADDGQYLTDRLTDEAVKFIRTNKEKPFFLYLSHHAVHTPIQAKAEMVEKYKDKRPTGGQDNPKYAAMVESVDQSVGRVLDTLDEMDLADNTVVVFFSDNGGYANATAMPDLRGSKGQLYEGGIRVPCIVRGPKISPRNCDVPIIGIDFYPTILEMAGVAKPAGYTLDGESLVGLIEEQGSLKRDAIFWHFPAYLEPYNDSQWPWRIAPSGAVRQGPWKLIECFEDGHVELYNLDNDLRETHDLAKQMPAKARELHRLLIQWRKDVSAPVPTALNPKFDPNSLKKQS